MLVYVDDIILTVNDESSIRDFINSLHVEFAIKYVGTLIYFLGLEVSYTINCLFFNQSKYAHDILTCACLLESKLIVIPLSMNDIFISSGTPYHDPNHYRSLVAAL